MQVNQYNAPAEPPRYVAPSHNHHSQPAPRARCCSFLAPSPIKFWLAGCTLYVIQLESSWIAFQLCKRSVHLSLCRHHIQATHNSSTGTSNCKSIRTCTLNHCEGKLDCVLSCSSRANKVSYAEEYDSELDSDPDDAKKKSKANVAVAMMDSAVQEEMDDEVERVLNHRSDCILPLRCRFTPDFH